MSLLHYLLIAGVSFCTLSSLCNAMDEDDQPGNNPIKVHGFDQLHKMGLTGEGQTIAFIEERQTKDINTHPFFFNKSEGSLKLFDYSRNTVWDGFENCFSLRYTDPDYRDIIQDIQTNVPDYSNGHDTQVIGLAIGHKTSSFCGGAVPEASGIQYNYSSCYYTDYRFGNYMYVHFAGMNQYTCLDILNGVLNRTLNEEHRTGFNKKIQILQTKYSHLKLDQPVDSSLYEALIAAITSEAKVINISQNIPQLTDPFNNYMIPTHVLDALGLALQQNDKIMVITPGNDFNVPPEVEQYEIEQNSSVAKRSFVKNTYLNCLALHPIISQRLLIPINVYPCEDTFFNYEQGSNRPLKYEWGKCAVCAVGTNIYFDTEKGESGTSLAAPLVSSLCSIINQVSGGKLSAAEIVESVKSNTISLGDQETYGHGLINPLGTIKAIKDLFKS